MFFTHEIFHSTIIQLTTNITLRATFHTSRERAFQTPILGDARQFLNGYRFQPPVTGFGEDATWGQVNGLRYPETQGNAWIPKGRLFTDQVLERKENHSWKWRIYDFQVPMLFFAYQAIGEWTVAEKQPDQIEVAYSYTFYAKNPLFHLFTRLFCLVQWKGMMQQALRGIQKQAESEGAMMYR